MVLFIVECLSSDYVVWHFFYTIYMVYTYNSAGIMRIDIDFVFTQIYLHYGTCFYTCVFLLNDKLKLRVHIKLRFNKTQMSL